MKNRIFSAALLALPLAVSTAHAQDSSSVRISGFGTGALTWSNNDQAEFVRQNQSSGAKKDPRTGVDSDLGLQADYNVNSWLSVTGQGLVRKDGEDNYGAELSWAFAKAKLSDNLSVRVGRIAIPAFMISEYRNVGYANTFLRPPQEVYSQMPLNSIDGADVTWQQQYANTTYTTQAAYGRSTVDLAGNLKAKATREYALSVTAEHGPFTVRVGRSGTKFTTEKLLYKLVNTFDASGTAFNIPKLNDIGAKIGHQQYTFTSIGLGLDWKNIVVQSEYAKRDLPDSFLGTSKSWYVMGGYRFGKFLPYYTYAKLTPDAASNNVPTSCPAGASPACAPTLGALYGAFDLARANINATAQSTNTIGLRWDFMASADIKIQIDRIKPNPQGLFINAQPGFKGPVTVGAVAVDFIF